jgi:uncharacterized LabA/DUF88 family protein
LVFHGDAEWIGRDGHELIRSNQRPSREYDKLKVKRPMLDANNTHHATESLDEQLDHAAEELITGDSDDPPLSEETVAEMLRVSLNTSAAKELPRAQGRF